MMYSNMQITKLQIKLHSCSCVLSCFAYHKNTCRFSHNKSKGFIQVRIKRRLCDYKYKLELKKLKM